MFLVPARRPLHGEDESSPHGRAEMRKRMLKLTAEEEQKDLLKTPLGPATFESNRNQAESLYREAISLDRRFPDPHRDLGMLYQDEGNSAGAIRAYQIYLDLAT